MTIDVKYSYIAVEGPIGVGKTTLSRLIARRLDAHTVMEDVQNPFLEDFYAGKKGSAFQCQLFFLLNRYQQQRELAQRSLFDSKVVTDYIPPKDKIFAHLTLDDSELIIYQKLYGLLMENLPRPEVVIYLQANVQTLKKRIRSRNRKYEKQIADRYIEELAKAYNYFFFHYHDTPLLIVNTNEVDFERNASELDHLLTQLNRLESGVLLYAPLGSS